MKTAHASLIEVTSARRLLPQNSIPFEADLITLSNNVYWPGHVDLARILARFETSLNV